jgi:Zn-dependent protease
MNKRAIYIGHILGASIQLDYSWLVFSLVLAWAFAAIYLPPALTLPRIDYWLLGAAIVLLMLLSVFLHELGHLAVARGLRVPVHRVTLHVFGGVTDLVAEPTGMISEILVALAGPFVSLVLAALFEVVKTDSSALAPLVIVAQYLVLINAMLALFNLIPAFPLDGGCVSRAIVLRISANASRATRIAANAGRVIAFMLIAFGIWQVFRGDWNGWWIVLVAWLVQGAAGRLLAQQSLHDSFSLAQAQARNLGDVLVAADETLQQLVDEYLANIGARAFLVQQNGATIGRVTWRQINAVPQADWQTTTVAQIMSPVSAAPSVAFEERNEPTRVSQSSFTATGHHPA